MIYLDNAATTKPSSKVMTTVLQDLLKHWGNPSSKYSFGVDAKLIMQHARAVVSNFIGAEKLTEIIFTSGSCEANSLALIGYMNKNEAELITTNIEHKSIKMIGEKYKAKIIPVDSKGFINMNLLEELCKTAKKTPLVSIQWANNEIGTIQDMERISQIVHKYHGILHTDATQIVPDRNITVDGIDMLSFSGQKLNAPKGIGVLYVKDGIELEPLIYGSQELGRRGGTENVAFIDGLRAAIEEIKYPDMNIRDLLIKEILYRIKGSYLVGSIDNRLSNNVSICFPGFESNTLLKMLSAENICVSTGSACNSNSINPSYVLQAIDMDERDIYSVLRFTISSNTKKEDLDKTVKTLFETINNLLMMNQIAEENE